MRFTDRGLKALKAQDDRYEVAEDNGHGFRLRVYPSGQKTFLYRYKVKGRSRVMSFGNYPDEISLADAHREHAKARAELKKGIDPGAVKRAEVAAEWAAETVGQLAQDYIERHAKRTKKTWHEDQRILDKDVLPKWGALRAKDIRRRDVIALLDAIVDRGAQVAANRTLEIIRKMFNFAIERDIVENNPCYMVKAPGKEKQRDRILSEREIVQFWEGMDSGGVSDPVKVALRLQLVTAQRRGEVVSARWDDIDGEWWTIPKTKNQLSHRVPLSPLALDLLDQLRELTGFSSFLFPNPSKTGHIEERAPTRAVDRLRSRLDMERFTPHDLRRTAASSMASMGTPRLVISKILNHVETGITAVYDRHSYDNEKRQALDDWGRKLSAILEGNAIDNVVALAARG